MKSRRVAGWLRGVGVGMGMGMGVGVGVALGAMSAPSTAHAAPLQCPAAESPAPDSGLAVMPGVLGYTMQSAVNGQRYRIWIHRPSATVQAPPGGFPVLYVLDGNATFVLAAQAARLQERVTGGLIVVGVDAPGNALFDLPSRYRDLTSLAPPDAWGVPRGKDGAPLKTGGADAFREVLVDEVPAVVDACAHADRQRTTLFGHSLAGYFVLHTMFTHPDSFGRYIAASPSIWWNDRAVLKDLLSFGSDTKKSLHLMVGGSEQTLADTATAARVERVTHAAMNDNVQAMYARLKQTHGNDVDVSLDVFSGANHVSYLPAALSEAVTEAAAQH
ncbi:alpha/beta hydrolase-fold protein [Paraburkholderia sp.]|uniref:alpha/beta hydrolase n=1 Tax=Paraburkholderia sp. TaxID=1926495 RepID=UPI0023993760|nr:alpha/beta hydrolase-fold protein [Paraburkholderia sp.]MDE1178975.1 alpha/beta hydrolase-fold protein [Paraburkholderia sp.]